MTSKPHSEVLDIIDQVCAAAWHDEPEIASEARIALNELVEQLEAMRNSLVRARGKLMVEVHAPQTLAILNEALDEDGIVRKQAATDGEDAQATKGTGI